MRKRKKVFFVTFFLLIIGCKESFSAVLEEIEDIKTRISIVWSSFRDNPCLYESRPYWEGVKGVASVASHFFECSKSEESTTEVPTVTSALVSTTADVEGLEEDFASGEVSIEEDASRKRMEVPSSMRLAFGSSVESAEKHNMAVREMLSTGDRGDFSLLFESFVERRGVETRTAGMHIFFQPFEKKIEDAFFGRLYIDTLGIDGIGGGETGGIHLRTVEEFSSGSPYISFEYMKSLNYGRVIDSIRSFRGLVYKYYGPRVDGEWNGITLSLKILRDVGLEFLLPKLSREELDLSPIYFAHKFLEPVEEFYKKILELPVESRRERILESNRFLVKVGSGTDKNYEINEKILLLRIMKRKLWSSLKDTFQDIGQQDYHLFCQDAL